MVKKRKDYLEKRDKILKAIKEVEREQLFKPWGPKQLEVKLEGEMTDRTILRHLKELERISFYLKRCGRGYLSKNSLFWKERFQEFLVRDVYEDVPKLEGKQFEKFFADNSFILQDIQKEYENKNPLWRLRHRKESQNVNKNLLYAKIGIAKDLSEDLAYIGKATDIFVSSSKPIPDLYKYQIQEHITELVYKIFLHEEALARENGRKFSLDDFGLSLIVNIEPKKAGKPPSRARDLKLSRALKNRQESQII